MSGELEWAILSPFLSYEDQTQRHQTGVLNQDVQRNWSDQASQGGRIWALSIRSGERIKKKIYLDDVKYG